MGQAALSIGGGVTHRVRHVGQGGTLARYHVVNAVSNNMQGTYLVHFPIKLHIRSF